MTGRQHTPDLSIPRTKDERRRDAFLDLILALAIGAGLAGAMAAWALA